MNYDYIEFSKIYKRVMDVELRLKYQFKFAMQSAFPKNMFSRLIYYMQANLIGRYTDGIGKQKRDKIKDLIASKKSETEKLDKFINMAYLSDLINMLVVYPIIYKNKNFTKTFYTNKKVNFNDVKKFGGRLKKLRNIIMHFQIADYKLTTKDNFEALAYWEQILNCEKQGIHTLNISSLTTDNILKQLKSCLDYSKSNYREICDYYDDVALSNGVSTKNLSDYDEILKLLKLIKEQFISIEN